MAHSQPSLKISWKSVRKFLRKAANRQRLKHIVLAEVTMATITPTPAGTVRERPSAVSSAMLLLLLQLMDAI